MGWTWEVSVWGKHDGEDEPYSNRAVWTGESALRAIVAFVKTKRSKKYGCVSLIWRG